MAHVPEYDCLFSSTGKRQDKTDVVFNDFCGQMQATDALHPVTDQMLNLWCLYLKRNKGISGKALKRQRTVFNADTKCIKCLELEPCLSYWQHFHILGNPLICFLAQSMYDKYNIGTEANKLSLGQRLQIGSSWLCPVIFIIINYNQTNDTICQ